MTSDLAPTAAPAAASARGPIPVSFFSIAVGLLALAAAWRVATPLWHLPPEAAQALTWAGIAVWLVLLAMYAAKWLRHPADAQAELEHPVQSSFAALGPVASMLAAVALLPYALTV